jgi:hypothetical protein
MPHGYELRSSTIVLWSKQMPNMAHYMCASELLPVVEAALAAHGYVVETPHQKQLGGDTLLVMTRGAAIVLLSHGTQRERAEIEVWGDAQSAATALLESLPIPLQRHPHNDAHAERTRMR